MSKWADYGISAVRFNSAHTHIDKVWVHPDNETLIGLPVGWWVFPHLKQERHEPTIKGLHRLWCGA